MAKFEKGNPGRPKGAKNRISGNLKAFINDLIDSNEAQIKKDLKALEAKDRLMFIEKLFQYTIPRLQAIQADVNIQNNLEQMSEAQLNQLIYQILQEDEKS